MRTSQALSASSRSAEGSETIRLGLISVVGVVVIVVIAAAPWVGVFKSAAT